MRNADKRIAGVWLIGNDVLNTFTGTGSFSLVDETSYRSGSNQGPLPYEGKPFLLLGEKHLSQLPAVKD